MCQGHKAKACNWGLSYVEYNENYPQDTWVWLGLPVWPWTSPFLSRPLFFYLQDERVRLDFSLSIWRQFEMIPQSEVEKEGPTNCFPSLPSPRFSLSPFFSGLRVKENWFQANMLDCLRCLKETSSKDTLNCLRCLGEEKQRDTWASCHPSGLHFPHI